MTTVIIKRYSLAFKHSVVREYEAGESLTGLNHKYGIAITSIKRWVEQLGRLGTRHKLMVIQQPEEQNQLHELKKRIADLEKALAQVTLDKIMLTATLEVAEREYGINVKKTLGPLSSTPPTSKQKRFQ